MTRAPWTPSQGIEPELLAALGRMTVSYNALELAIRQVIGMLIGTEAQVGQILTAGLTMPGLLDRLGAMVRHRLPGTPLKDLDAAMGLIEGVQTRRNALIHSNWFGGSGSAPTFAFRVTAKAQAGWKRHRVDVRPADVDRLVSDIDAAREQLAEFFAARFPELQPQAEGDY